MNQLFTLLKRISLFALFILLTGTMYSSPGACQGTPAFAMQGMMEDTIPPQITCPMDLNFECYTEIPPPCQDLDEFLQAGGAVSDETGIDSSSFILASQVQAGICPRVITRTYQVSDLSGNTSSCAQVITDNDITPPTIICPPDLTFECITELPAPDISLIATSDNCGAPIVTWVSDVSDGYSCPEIITRTYMATDSCGNTATCLQVFTIIDVTPPVISCPADTIVECMSSTLAPNISLVTASDNCGVPSVTFISDVISGINPTVITRTYMATDSCGNTASCLQLITSYDTIPPILTCPTDLSAVCSISEVPLYATLTEFIAAGGVTEDNCAIDSSSFVLVGQVSDSLTCPETVTRTYQVSDFSGLTTTCQQLIIINDIVPPTITCPPDTTVICDINEVPPFISLSEFITAGGDTLDNCIIDAPSFTLYSEVSDGLSCPETITRTYGIADFCGNTSTCTQIIVINDTVPPNITCPPDLSVECYADVPPPFISLDEFVTAGGTADDNCGIDTLEFLYQTKDGIQCPVIFTRYYEVTDKCGNFATCQHKIIVEDTEPPIINCPPDVHVDSMEQVPQPFIGLSEYLAAGGSFSDNCGYIEGSFSLFEEIVLGEDPVVIERTYSIADSCSNPAYCTMTITVGGNFGIYENERTDLGLMVIPNPSDGKMDLLFELREPATVKVFVGDLLGNKARHMNFGRLNQGEQKVSLDLQDLPAGIYFIKLSAGKTFATSKLVLTDF